MNYALMLNPSMIRPLIFRWRFNSKIAWFLGFSLITSLVVFYVFQVSYVTQASFTIADYEKQIADLDKEFKNLQLNFSNVSSLSSLEETLVARGYEKVGKIHYIQVLESAVVTK